MSGPDLFSEDWGRSHARGSDPFTSQAAAARVTTAATMTAVLEEVYRTHPEGLTAEQACVVAGYSAADGGWKRVSDLTRTGVVRDSGRTARGSSGRDQRVLVYVPPRQRGEAKPL